MSAIQEQLAAIRARIREIGPEELARLRESTPGLELLDVREGEEYREGHLPGARHLSRGFLELKIESEVPDKSRPIVAYCAGGTRSLLAAEALTQLGYQDVRSLAGGYTRWKSAGLPTEAPRTLSEAERRRYSRHVLIPEVGEAGQLQLLKSRVLLIGAGGLGSPAAYYLAAAGVGTLGLIDMDVIDESNLQRQILHTTERIGTSKVHSAIATLHAFNPQTTLIPIEERIDSTNVDRILAQGWDLILDGSDNFPTRYLVNDASIKHGLPVVHGSVFRFEGQVTVFDPAHGSPCYRCLFPEPPPPGLAPSCAEAGVLGVLPGVMGLLQAVETIKVLLGIGEPLLGRLLTYDGLRGKFRELRLSKDPKCRYCNPSAEFPGYIDYEQFCALTH